ncbi:DUF2195 family protein [Ochrobactrum sp. A-1]|uniref:DUF2195 family protein n=1 Tax=Ochrobactrum sp. A-1 TaxID=2920940 RepID=UPI0018AA8AB7|nr:MULTISPECIES: DUF2195 family protein [unclassified Ochrobactrum]MCH4538654.1 DUF2195 family protein [Ochrobactrum sp. A-1]
MFKLIYCAALMASICGLAGAADAGGIAFENKLASCVTVKNEPPVSNANAITVITRFQIHKSIGNCGCFSARATYTSSIDIDGVQEVLQQGVLLIDEDAVKTLIIASEARLAGDRKIKVKLNCAGPT